MTINPLAAPPTAAQIAELRAAVQSQTRFEDTAAFKTLMFCPIPLVDVLASAAVYGVESAMKPDLSAPFADVPGSNARTWPEGSIAADYAAKVAAQGRSLIVCELEALERAVNIESAVQVAGAAASKAANAFLGELLSPNKT